MLLSVIIVNYNTPQVTIDCLNSLKYHGGSFHFPFEVILVDNAPRQDHQAAFEACIAGLVYLKTDRNIGFGKANNLGMEQAKGKYFLLLNSDTLLIDDSLNKAMAYMESGQGEKTGLLGCKLLNEDLSYQHSFYPFTGNSMPDYFKANNPVLSKLFKTHRHFTETDKITKVGDISGAFMLLRASVFHTLKGFDPDFFLYCEETEWCRNRITRHYDIIYYPDTRIIHLGGKSAPKNKMAIQAAISEYLFWYKCGILHYVLFFLVNALNFITQLLIYPFVSAANRIDLGQYVKKYFVSLRYALTDIPAYSRRFGARSKPLYYHEAENIFFGA